MHNEVEEQGEAKFYYGESCDYTAEINCGGLKIPNDNVCQWTIFSYILFNEIVCKVCRKSLCNVLFHFQAFFKKTVHLYAPRSSKEPQQKILELQSKPICFLNFGFLTTLMLCKCFVFFLLFCDFGKKI